MSGIRDEVYAGTDLTPAEIDAATKFAQEKPSTSYLQRRMQIPYSHAMRLMVFLEAAQIVSPRNSAGFRTVLKRQTNVVTLPVVRIERY